MDTLDTIVIGAGQAGLAAGYHLARSGRSFVILDGADRVGGSWHNRWDSMRLFTPASHDSLPGMRLPGGYRFPSAVEMAQYLEAYADRFHLPVRTGVVVDGLFREGAGFRVTAAEEAFLARNVIVAVGVHRRPRIPVFATKMDPAIVQMHSADYRNPDQLRQGTVLVVGAGNSGAEIAIEIARTHPTILAGRHPGQLPIDIRRRRTGLIFPAIWWTWTHVLTERTPMGRKQQAEARKGHGDTLIRLKVNDIAAAGITRCGRIVGTEHGSPRTDEHILDVANVIWCTGFVSDFDWISIPGMDVSGRLPNHRGRVDGQPGLYVLGQEYQHMFNSHLVGGVGMDAKFVVRDIARRPVADPTALTYESSTPNGPVRPGSRTR